MCHDANSKPLYIARSDRNLPNPQKGRGDLKSPFPNNYRDEYNMTEVCVDLTEVDLSDDVNKSNRQWRSHRSIPV